MRYDDARNMIQTGDLVAVRRRTGLLAAATRFVTESPYTHTGVAIWAGVAGERLLMAHINGGGCSFVPVSQMAAFDFDVYPCPVNRLAAETVAFAVLGDIIKYSISDLARIAAHIKLGAPLPAQPSKRICSSLSAHIYLEAGWRPRNLPSIPWPAAIVAAIDAEPVAKIRR